MDWTKIKHFSPSEFDSPDSPGSGTGMEYDIVAALDAIRSYVGFPLVIVSGIRTPAHNAEVGGVDSSAHTFGYAADIACRTSAHRHAIISAIYKLNLPIYRIGIGQTFIHLDTDPMKPQRVIWLY